YCSIASGTQPTCWKTVPTLQCVCADNQTQLNKPNATEPHVSTPQHQSAPTRHGIGWFATARTSPRLPITANNISTGRNSVSYRTVALSKNESVNALIANDNASASTNHRSADVSVADRPRHDNGAANASQTSGILDNTPNGLSTRE